MFLATSLPSAMAMEQFASLSASVSLTPSPVIATTFPCVLSVLTMVCFCSGVTRPKTVNLLAICATSCKLMFSREIYLSLSFTPTRFAIFETVKASSPEMILISTLFSLNQEIVSMASFLMWSSSTKKATSFPRFPALFSV